MRDTAQIDRMRADECAVYLPSNAKNILEPRLIKEGRQVEEATQPCGAVFGSVRKPATRDPLGFVTVSIGWLRARLRVAAARSFGRPASEEFLDR